MEPEPETGSERDEDEKSAVTTPAAASALPRFLDQRLEVGDTPFEIAILLGF